MPGTWRSRCEGAALIVAGVFVLSTGRTLSTMHDQLRSHPVGHHAAGILHGLLDAHLWAERRWLVH